MAGPNLMRDIFPDYCAPDRLPQTERSLEHSRFLAYRKGLSTTEYMKVLGRLLLAVHEYALHTDVTRIASLTYMTHYNLAVRLFKARPLGLPRIYKEAYRNKPGRLSSPHLESFYLDDEAEGLLDDIIFLLTNESPHQLQTRKKLRKFLSEIAHERLYAERK